MKKIILLLILQILGLTICTAQFPHISGTIKVSIKSGLIEGDLEISNIPRIEGYSILLNAGLNIRYFRDSSDEFNYSYDRYYDDEVSFEAFQYYFPSKNRTKRFLPKTFKISYVGAFPVIADTLKASEGDDWKGNIAFNGQYLRATEQSAWYPILYDTLNDVKYEKVTYDLKIICDDGRSIYLNGSPPVSGTQANLTSNIPVELLLFAGNYDFTKKDQNYFINTFLTDKQQTVLSNWTNRIKDFYEKKLNIPYGTPIVFLGAAPVSRKNNWEFVTYPTIAVVGRDRYSIKGFFKDTTGELRDSSIIGYFCHELGHYYFGTYFVPNAELQWAFLEGFTEYISLQATREILGEEYYKKSISKYISRINNYAITPLYSIKKPSEIGEEYKYDYIPLLLTALEKEIGKEKIWKWLNIVLTSKNAKTNYDFFKSTLLESGVTQKEFNVFESTYIKSDNAKQNVIDKAK